MAEIDYTKRFNEIKFGANEYFVFCLTFKGKIPHSLLPEKNQSLAIFFYLYITNMLF